METANLDGVLRKLVAGEELMLVDLTLTKVGRSHIIRILVDCQGRVTISQCARLSRKIKDTIDTDMLLKGENYRLEVSSPGVGRLLHTEVDWNRTIGRKLGIELDDEVIVDWLEHYDDGILTFRSGRVVAVDAIRKALEVLE
ncbi:MAG: hypothetical protein K8R76_08960 [Candidatus Aegiribacteria sp.]|nr:hypothetical protein [Candidatus Aegiribacteria sp.]